MSEKPTPGNWILFGLLMIALSGCQTNMLSQFNKVQTGMDKHDVLEIMGSPTTKTRLHGKDRWIYSFYADDKRYEKEIHLLNGDVVYAGDKWKAEPEKTAEVIDQQNEVLNARLEKEEKDHKLQGKKSYENFEDEMSRSHKVLYMPDFKPVE